MGRCLVLVGKASWLILVIVKWAIKPHERHTIHNPKKEKEKERSGQRKTDPTTTKTSCDAQ